MRIGFNVLPLKNAHRFRGIGVYTINLLEELRSRSDLEIEEFEDINNLGEVDLIHYTTFDLFFSTLPVRKKFSTVVTIHDVIPLIFPEQHPVGVKGKINFFRQKFALKSCKKIITVSEVSKKDIINFLKISEEKITVIKEAASPSMRILSEGQTLRIKRKFNLPDNFLLYVGDANYVKNLPFLIEGFDKIKQKAEFSDLKLILVGNVFLKKLDNIDHPELKSLKQVNEMIKNLKLEQDILRPGQLDLEDLIGFYNSATIYVQPSLYEGFGLPVLEAMSCGTPVLSSNVGSLHEIGEAAPVYFNPRNLEQFVKVLVDVLQSRSLQDKLSKLGLIQAAKFSWEKVANETIEVYRQAIANK